MRIPDDMWDSHQRKMRVITQQIKEDGFDYFVPQPSDSLASRLRHNGILNTASHTYFISRPAFDSWVNGAIIRSVMSYKQWLIDSAIPRAGHIAQEMAAGNHIVTNSGIPVFRGPSEMMDYARGSSDELFHHYNPRAPDVITNAAGIEEIDIEVVLPSMDEYPQIPRFTTQGHRMMQLLRLGNAPTRLRHFLDVRDLITRLAIHSGFCSFRFNTPRHLSTDSKVRYCLRLAEKLTTTSAFGLAVTDRHQRVVLASLHPTSIHFGPDFTLHNDSGPAIEWADGTKIYALNGIVHNDIGRYINIREGRTHVPVGELSDGGGTFLHFPGLAALVSTTTMDADSSDYSRRGSFWASNAEVMRVIIEQYGLDDFMEHVVSETVSRDEYGTLFSVSGATRSFRYVVVENATPEPDGSRKTYLLPVPPTITSAKAGVAWTMGYDNADEYEPEAES